jgi:hypothetical protein
VINLRRSMSNMQSIIRLGAGSPEADLSPYVSGDYCWHLYA